MDELSYEIDYDRLAKFPEQTVAEYCKINLRDLDTTLARSASFFAYVSVAYEMRRIEEGKKKVALDRAKARYYAGTTTPITRAQLEVDNDPAVIVAQDEYVAAQEDTARLRSLLNGLEKRHEMLVQISARKNRLGT